MTFETRLAAAFERYAEGAPIDVEPIQVARLAMYGDTRPRAAIHWSDLRTPAWRYAAVLALLLLVLVAAVLIGSALMREPHLPIVQGEFTRTGPLTTEGTRQAVPLADGRVLLIGIGSQRNTGTEFGVAEIYEPTTNQVDRLEGEPVIRRWGGQGIVRLADGRVLLTGGTAFEPEGGGDHPAPTEIIDPATGSVTTVGQMVHPRYGHTATLLQDGRVLIAGGDVGGDISKQDPPAELFDPATGTFRAIDPLQHARLYHRASVLNDGRVLLTGGMGDGYVLQAELFDPASERFEVVGDLGHGRVDHSATLLDDGRVLLVGGSGIDPEGIISGGALTSAELFDPATSSFSVAGALTTERSQHAAVLLEDGRVLIAGGYNQDGSPSTTELFDSGAGQFVRGADTLDRVGNATAALLPDGKVFVLGEAGPPELFDLSNVGPAAPTPGPRNGDVAGTVTSIDAPAVERFAHTATLLPDGRVLVVGGNVDDQTPLDTAELYDPGTGHWSATGSLHEARAYHTAALLPDGRVLVVGGQVPVTEPDGTRTYGAIDSAEVYDPATGSFARVGPMSIAHGGGAMCCGQVAHFPATVLPDGRVLIGGGTDKRGLDVFDPRTNTFTGVQTRCQGGTVLLPDGRFLLGCGGGYVFDPASGRVDAVPDLDALRQLGTRLPDGRVLFSDAIGSEPLVLHPEFDPVEALPWSAMVTFNDVLWDRFGIGTNVQTITPLRDGRSLVFARRPGDTNHPLQLGLAAVFDPRLVTFEEVASPTGRFANTATMLQDGRILFVGKPTRSPDRTDPHPPVAELLDLGLPR